MNLISYTSKKTFIFLSREIDFVVATIVSDNKIVGIKHITEKQRLEIITNRNILAAKNVFIIEQTQETVALLKSAAVASAYVAEVSIPSPYFLNLDVEEFFLTTQKTRGPNK